MSKFTDFLNLFKWDSIEDAEEEFDIDKSLNENWDKIDKKLKDYITNTDDSINSFKTSTNNDMEKFKNDTTDKLSEFKTNINNSIDNLTVETEKKMNTFKEDTNKIVENLKDKINETQKVYKYTLQISESTLAGAEITLPCYYKVGQDVLDVYLNGERLINSSDETGTDGHYVEVGDADSISNKIKMTSDWSVSAGMIFEFAVKGEYSI